MKRFIFFGITFFTVSLVFAQVTPTQQMEKLQRDLTAVKTDGGILISWRLMGYDPSDVKFNLYKDGKIIRRDIADRTNYLDKYGNTKSQYYIETIAGHKIIEKSQPVKPWDKFWKCMPVNQPSGGNIDGREYSYVPSEASCGDVDGDGEYEIILKWLPTNSADNSFRNCITAPTIVDCYKLFGKKMWRIDLGINIRSGFHYEQLMVYDLDGDGKAEIVMKTAPGTTDGTGHYASEAADDSEIKGTDNHADYRSTTFRGVIMDGPEYLTVFNGITGKAENTVYYIPNRAGGKGIAQYPADNTFWGDNYANRSERYLACIAYLAGADKNPSVVMCRGYYTRAYLCAWDYTNKKLKLRWLHASTEKTTYSVTSIDGKTTTYHPSKSESKSVNDITTAYAQGAHSLAVADVDADGDDEITYGSAAIDNDGTLLYTTGLGHGDAQHLTDMNPDRPGLEYYMVLETNAAENYSHGDNYRDARTGEILAHHNADEDTGRGMAADIDSLHRGFEYWSSASRNVYNIDGSVISQMRPSVCFRIYWDGEPYDMLLDGTRFSKWDSKQNKAVQVLNVSAPEYGNSATFTSKSAPVLTADLLGDWREEVIEYNRDCQSLNIYTTPYESPYRVPTLMHDHVYRLGVAWQNVAYNQPPHLGYYLPDFVKGKLTTNNHQTHKQ